MADADRQASWLRKRDSRKLISIGINTIGDAAHTELSLLQSCLGKKMGAYIHERANGRDESEVHYEVREAKSYSNETTTAVDVTASNYESYAVPILKQLCEKVSGRLRKDGVYGSTVSVIVKTAGFRRHTRQTTLVNSTNDAGTVFSNAKKLMRELLYCFVMNSVAHNKRMNRDTTSESIIHCHLASMWEARYVCI